MKAQWNPWWNLVYMTDGAPPLSYFTKSWQMPSLKITLLSTDLFVHWKWKPLTTSNSNTKYNIILIILMHNIKIKVMLLVLLRILHLHFISFIWDVSMKANFLTDKLIKPMFFHTWNTSSKHAHTKRDRQTDRDRARHREREEKNMIVLIHTDSFFDTFYYYNITLN